MNKSKKLKTENIKKLMKPKLFFEKSNNIYKPPARLSKEKKRRHKLISETKDRHHSGSHRK